MDLDISFNRDSTESTVLCLFKNLLGIKYPYIEGSAVYFLYFPLAIKICTLSTCHFSFSSIASKAGVFYVYCNALDSRRLLILSQRIGYLALTNTHNGWIPPPPLDQAVPERGWRVADRPGANTRQTQEAKE